MLPVSMIGNAALVSSLHRCVDPTGPCFENLAGLRREMTVRHAQANTNEETFGASSYSI